MIYFPNHIFQGDKLPNEVDVRVDCVNGMLRFSKSQDGMVYDLKVPSDPAQQLDYLDSIKDGISWSIENTQEGRSLEVVVSSIDRYSVGLITAIYVRSGRFKRIYFTYRKAKYFFKGQDLESELKKIELRDYVNDRDTEIVSIPYCEGKHRPSTYKYFAHMFGFDFFRTSNLLRSYEPREVIAMGSPQPDPVEMKGAHSLPEHIELQIDDVELTVESLRKWNENVPKEVHEKATQSIVFASGWKPHIVTSVIWSVLEAEVPVFVPTPDAVIPIDRRETGEVFVASLTRS